MGVVRQDAGQQGINKRKVIDVRYRRFGLLMGAHNAYNFTEGLALRQRI